ncbi:palmitoyltransferase ZDHHC9-like isoform X2 [Symsagittifera roscoffensis]|uniref:palmitoyltransferase ZDHHC9-like isoform X2 n=1 Tax=Symsagittifera roscoffensis TaxID=84072 RepID=UPI00307C5B10
MGDVDHDSRVGEFPGKNTVCCGGRVVTGREWPFVVGGLIFVSILVGMFAVAEAPFLIEHFSIVVVVIPIVLLLYGLLNFLCTLLKDPGIIPRSTQSEACYLERDLEKTVAVNSKRKGKEYEPTVVVIGGVDVEIKWCSTCRLWRPPRASHCRICDNCIEMFDHHCAYMGNCIGRRNYRFFYMYLLSMSILLVYDLVFSLYHLVHSLITKDKLVNTEAVLTAINCLILGMTSMGVLVFLSMHVYLVAYGLTASEESKGVWTPGSGTQSNHSPFTSKRGCAVNTVQSICGPQYPRCVRVEKRCIAERSLWVDLSNSDEKVGHQSHSESSRSFTSNSVHPIQIVI